MGDRLDIQLPEGVGSVAAALLSGGFDALLVGGAVRDALLGERAVDFDLVTDAQPPDVRALADGATGVRAVYDLGERFGTIGVALDDGTRLEVTRYRPDALELPSAPERFAVDAAHRDFTANALAVDLATGKPLDPLGARGDLESRLLRAPGDPAKRFAEDPLRVLRAARFAAELGFELEARTAVALPFSAPDLARVACERVREELTKLLTAEWAERGLMLLRDSGALGVVLPEIAALDGVTQPSFHDLDVLAHTVQTVGLAPRAPLLRWAALLHDVGKGPTRTIEADGRIRFFRHAQVGAEIAESICRRLCMSRADTSAIVHLVTEHMRLGDVNFDNDRSVDRAVRKLDLPAHEGSERLLASAEDAVALTLADFGATAHRAETPALEQVLVSAVRESRARGTRSAIVSPVGGRELMHELGIPEGELVGVAKRAIEDAIERGELPPDDKLAAIATARLAVGYHLGAPDNHENDEE